MKYSLAFLDIALLDLANIKAYLTLHSERAWPKLLETMEKHVGHLRDFPNMGERYKHYRRLVCGDYSIFYSVDDEKALVEIYRILHKSQDVRRHLEEDIN